MVNVMPGELCNKKARPNAMQGWVSRACREGQAVATCSKTGSCARHGQRFSRDAAHHGALTDTRGACMYEHALPLLQLSQHDQFQVSCDEGLQHRDSAWAAA